MYKRQKLTYAGKPVKLEKEYPAQPITAARSDIYGLSLIHIYPGSLDTSDNFMLHIRLCKTEHSFVCHNAI